MRFEIRRLREKDLEKGFFETLQNLKATDLNPDLKKARQVFDRIKNNPCYNIFVAVSPKHGVVGVINLFLEETFNHDFAKKGHLEGFVVREGFEGQGIASSLLKKVEQVATKKGCHNVIGACRDELVKFYEKRGFECNTNFIKKKIPVRRKRHSPLG